MKELLIVSTYGVDAARDWFHIQKRFIDRLAPFADFGVFLHEVKNEKRFRDCKIVGRIEGDLLYKLPEMFHHIKYYCRNHEYKNYLILDSDAFPVKKNWYKNLLELMGDRWYAAPVRTDNLDVVPHPCALFVKGEYIKEPIFTFRRALNPTKNLLGDEVIDIGTDFKMKYKKQKICYPLVRSNFINLHPIVGAIYGDTFYHHGGGSRTPYFRSTEYWEKVVPEHHAAGEMCYEWLKEKPEWYINKMRGKGIVETKETLREFVEKGSK